jgi:hypothetical protein
MTAFRSSGASSKFPSHDDRCGDPAGMLGHGRLVPARCRPVIGADIQLVVHDDRPDPGRRAVGDAIDAEGGDVQVVGLGDPLKITGCSPDHSSSCVATFGVRAAAIP